MSFFITSADGASALTPAGYVASVVILVAVFVIGLAIANREQKMTARSMAFSAVALAIAFLLSYVKLFEMPWGGSVTLCSMLFVVLIGYWYGPGVGFSAAFAFSMLQLMQSGGSYMLSPLQVCMDYLFAFTALGISGFFRNKKHGLLLGYICAVIVRGLFHVIGGYLFWMDYMPDNFPKSLAVIYPFAYNYSFLLAEAVITIIIISLPPVKNGLTTITKLARGENA